MKQCKCRIYGKDAPESGGMTVREKNGKLFCPSCGGHIDFKKGNYAVEVEE